MLYITAALFVLFALLPMPSFAEITKIVIDKRESFANGYEFPGSGAYEKIAGKAYGALDPSDAHNKIIVNLDKVPRNAQGRVEYDTDFYIMRPVDFSKGNRKILYDVTNRGRKALLPRMNDAPDGSGVNNPATVEDVGNAFCLPPRLHARVERLGARCVARGRRDEHSCPGGDVERPADRQDHSRRICFRHPRPRNRARGAAEL